MLDVAAEENREFDPDIRRQVFMRQSAPLSRRVSDDTRAQIRRQRALTSRSWMGSMAQQAQKLYSTDLYEKTDHKPTTREDRISVEYSQTAGTARGWRLARFFGKSSRTIHLNMVANTKADTVPMGNANMTGTPARPRKQPSD